MSIFRKLPLLFVGAIGSLFILSVPPVSAQGGLSTPGATVTAQNPGTSAQGSDVRITLVAHSQRSAIGSPSCRPADLTLRCWGSLVLRIPGAGGFSVKDFQVHRVVVGNTNCGESCGGDEVETSSLGAMDELGAAQVNGLAVVTDPGSTGLQNGAQVQVKIALMDNGTAQYADQFDVTVSEFVNGPDKPLVYDTGWQTIQQVTIRLIGDNG